MSLSLCCCCCCCCCLPAAVTVVHVVVAFTMFVFITVACYVRLPIRSPQDGLDRQTIFRQTSRY